MSSDATIRQTISRNIVAIRQERGWDQQRLAREAGLVAPTLSRIERGGTMPSLETVLAIADALRWRPGETLDALLAESQ